MNNHGAFKTPIQLLEEAFVIVPGVALERLSGDEQGWDGRNKICRLYEAYGRLVDVGARSWMRGDPYELGDWVKIFTPIENSAWGAIRDRGLPMWPQFPVGGYFLDFGNPVAKVALECDGRDFHNAVDDAERDMKLRALGWKTYRAPGWVCHADRYDEDGNAEDCGRSLNRLLDLIEEDIKNAINSQ